jgi:hypothetical protein
MAPVLWRVPCRRFCDEVCHLIANHAALKFARMKSIILLSLFVVVCFTSCRGGGGPATRVGRGVDHAFYKVGGGVKRVGQGIENAAR